MPASFVYSFVCRGNVVLADCTAYTGNFTTLAVQLLDKCPGDTSKFTFACNNYTFNYLQDSGYSAQTPGTHATAHIITQHSWRWLARTWAASCPMRFSSASRTSFCARTTTAARLHLHTAWTRHLGAQTRAHGTSNVGLHNRPRLRYWQEYMQEHPEEFNKVVSVQKKVRRPPPSSSPSVRAGRWTRSRA